MRARARAWWWLRLALLGALIACSDGDALVRPPCAASMYTAEVAFSGVDRIDVLFVISDAPSMTEEQAALQTQLPAAMRSALASETDGAHADSPVQDVKVAVVSASLADGGAFHRAPADAGLGCDQAPTFLRYRGPYFGPDHDDREAFVDQFACLARVGTAGAGPNQPLEAALLALSDPQRAESSLRSDPKDGLSLIHVVVIGDSDDCSLADGSGIATPATSGACADPAGMLESVQHYVDGLRALRAGNENMVTFSVLAGVPPFLVDDQARAGVDSSDSVARDAYYQRILDDPAMNAVPDPMNAGHLLPACHSEHASAEPARRLVEAARAFGENGDVLSICSDDWSGLFAPLQRRIEPALDVACLPHVFARGADARVPCKLYWDLPSPERAQEGTPTRCSQRRFLQPAPGAPRDPGGQRCEMRQLAIDDETDLAAVDPDDGGWYYDDFSADRFRRCLGGPERALVAFTPYSAPQSGVTVVLECFGAQVLSSAQDDAGSADAAACGVPQIVGPVRSSPYAPSGIGQRCTPAYAPAQGFEPRSVYLETGPSECASGVCMVYHLLGDPRPDCTACDWRDPACSVSTLCAEPEKVADRVYCTCRCDAGPGAPGCECPTGFSCQDTFALGGPGYEGGYCVKDGTVESR